MISISIKLCPKNTCSRDRTKNADIKNEHQLVYNCDTRHLLCSNLPNHYIVKHTNKIGYAIFVS